MTALPRSMYPTLAVLQQNMAVYSNIQLLLGKKNICNSSQMCEFDAVRGGGYVLSFWRVVQNIVAGVLQLVHV